MMETTDKPQLLLKHHLKQLKLPTFLAEYGLVNIIERRINFEGDPEWLAYAPPALDGAKAPDNRSATDRFLRAAGFNHGLSRT